MPLREDHMPVSALHSAPQSRVCAEVFGAVFIGLHDTRPCTVQDSLSLV